MTPDSLPWRDSARLYGKLTRLLHWSIAALMLWQFLGMGLRLALGRTPLVSFFVGSHQKVGTVLFLLIVLRVLWALANRRNRPDHGVGLLGLAARLGHGALYLVMALVPLAALLRAYGGERAFAPFGFEIFAARQPPIGWMVGIGDALHGEMAWLLLALIAGHVLMVGVHEGMWRDGTLARMAGRQRAGF
ncbi:cytochrome b [Paracoccus sp. PS-1]|uniref:cytochrome b n=1 Tax=unclassified Paracoccus (in: a-proteobacteria) TaxID=2688777 RepID=UPI00048B0628|nr:MULTISPECIES: cytochrome b/b6 domain-containing protein [unclassified Paracoccus (in: a-proteobacteria)]MDQ7260224.1 cytochrome b [Paracoccus sp. PS1]